MAEDNTLVASADGVFFESVENEDGLSINADNQIKSNLAGLIEARYADAQRARDSDENRWITAYHNFRGLYPKNVRFSCQKIEAETEIYMGSKKILKIISLTK